MDPKKGTFDFSEFAKNIVGAVNQEKLYLNNKLIDPKKALISNLGRVLELIRDNKIDKIEYLIVLG